MKAFNYLLCCVIYFFCINIYANTLYDELNIVDRESEHFTNILDISSNTVTISRPVFKKDKPYPSFYNHYRFLIQREAEGGGFNAFEIITYELNPSDASEVILTLENTDGLDETNVDIVSNIYNGDTYLSGSYYSNTELDEGVNHENIATVISLANDNKLVLGNFKYQYNQFGYNVIYTRRGVKKFITNRVTGDTINVTSLNSTAFNGINSTHANGIDKTYTLLTGNASDFKVGEHVLLANHDESKTLVTNTTLSQHDIDSINSIILIDKPYTIVGDVVIPDGTTLKFVKDGKIEVNTPNSLQINGTVCAGEHQIFFGDKNISGELNGSCYDDDQIRDAKTVIPQWWGVIADGKTDNSYAFKQLSRSIQSGWNISFPSGDYILDSGPFIIRDKSNITLTGQEESSVTLRPSIQWKNGDTPNHKYRVAYHSTLALIDVEKVELKNLTLESRGENWGNVDQVPRNYNPYGIKRSNWIATAGGIPLLVSTSTEVTLNNVNARLPGSVGAMYFSSSNDIHVNNSFANGSSYGIGAFAVDIWAHSIKNKNGNYFFNKSLADKEDSVGNMNTSGKSGIIIEGEPDYELNVTVTGGSYNNAHSSADNPLGCGINSISSHLTLTNVSLENNLLGLCVGSKSAGKEVTPLTIKVNDSKIIDSGVSGIYMAFKNNFKHSIFLSDTNIQMTENKKSSWLSHYNSAVEEYNALINPTDDIRSAALNLIYKYEPFKDSSIINNVEDYNGDVTFSNTSFFGAEYDILHSENELFKGFNRGADKVFGKLNPDIINRFYNQSIPSVPEAPTALISNNTTITIFWNNVEDAAYYIREVSINGADWQNAHKILDTTATYFHQQERSYSYRVKACNSADLCSGFSLPSEVVTVTLTPSRPEAPTAAISNGTTITVSWNSVDDAAYYIREVSINGADWQNAHKILDTTATYLHQQERSYSYRVKACNSADRCSDFSLPSEVVTVTLTPSRPGAPTAVISNGTTITVSWNNVDKATYYVREVSINGAAWQNATVISGTSISYTHQQVRSYRYRVKACNSADRCSDFSLPSEAVTVISIPLSPNAPTAVVSNGNTITISWNSVSNAAYYEREVSINGAAWQNTTRFTPTSAVFSNQQARTYAYRVRACDRFNRCSAYSPASNSVTITPPIPATPNAPMAVVFNGNSITVSWNSVGNAAYYIREVSLNGAAWQNATVVTGTSASYIHQQVRSYRYRVKACNSADLCSAYSAASSTVTVN